MEVKTPCPVEDYPPYLHVMVIGKKFDDEVPQIMTDLVTLIAEKSSSENILYVTDPQFLKVAKNIIRNTVLYDAKIHQHLVEYVITVGGDGTILYASKLFQNRSTPKLVPVEKGTLGFLCKFGVQDLSYVVQTVLKDHKQALPFESKMRIECIEGNPSTPRMKYQCLNEVAIIKAESGTQLKLELYIMDELFTVTAGDGILISTPTGSTAYSLSAGGPIIHNSVDTILIQPISPNSLSFRSICLPSNIHLRIKVSPQSKTAAFVTCDGQRGEDMSAGEEVNIKLSQYGVQMLSNPKQKQLGLWTSKLKQLLKWNKPFLCEACNIKPDYSTCSNGSLS